ncbi:MAG TPA: hypothetical protein H9857_06820 [Candidatus Desulfovibrio intestinigallinarum]|nr:hypothetical protein [Candidatus Desulfovibrio intestinigallinarum]
MNQNAALQNEEPRDDAENRDSELSEGFALALEDDDTRDASVPPAEADRNDDAPPEAERPAQKEEYVPPQDTTPPAPPLPLEEPDGRGTPETATQAAPPVRMLEAVPDDIAEELENLRRINPDAARLALEDSPEGESIRSRLESYGADLAMDKAERIMEQRERARHEEMRSRQAVEEHNRRFFATLDSRVPDYAAMMRDPGRAEELRAYQQELFRWIESKPYAEGARLMRVAQTGTNAEEVADLLSRFDAERNKTRTPDPGGALAVPGRRGPAVAPAGIGDKNDWDAGFRMALASDN